ncbi:MAG TPA: hypothetical protein VJN89_17995 [Candidatus Acidoferrum sp.]|nr:hypothetical protein [Candidatus Acidoferrum sp.]
MLATLAFSFAFLVHAGIRGPGKYCGVVVFDRWDACFLLSGPYITYISEKVKEELRPYKGQAVQVDAQDVFQPINPGDALIRQYKIIGPAPKTNPWITLDGLELIAASDFGDQGSPRFVIQIRNAGDSSVRIDSSEIAPVLLARSPNYEFRPSDGASVAVITRVDLASSPSGAWECAIGDVGYSASYPFDSATRPLTSFELPPGQSMSTKIIFKIPAGQYQFLFGYGGGVHEEKSLASNAISFDIGDGGVATLIE